MESAGTRLKNLRLEKGITLEEIQKKTKIHLDILKAIEEDSFINLSPVYIKGFLKIYCKFLGVDPRDYIPNYKEPQNIVRPSPGTEEKPVPLLKRATIKLISFKAINIKIVAFSFLIIIFVISLFNLGKIVSSKRGRLSKKAKLPVATAIKKEKDEQQTTKSQKAPSPTMIRLGIRTKDDCWVQLKADGRVVFQGLLKKGRFENWQAKDKIELSLGNAGVVDLEVNGKLISNLGRRGQVLKNILITKEGLSIGR